MWSNADQPAPFDLVRPASPIRRAQSPRPGVYLREVNLPDIHTKFLEAHRGALSELFDLVLPLEAIAEHVSGMCHFERRYGFLQKPLRVRFRVLDPECDILGRSSTPDVTLEGESFATLRLNVSRTFITENEINFLTFTKTKRSAVIFWGGIWLRNVGECRMAFTMPNVLLG